MEKVPPDYYKKEQAYKKQVILSLQILGCYPNQIYFVDSLDPCKQLLL
jgi:hypothetical protein